MENQGGTTIFDDLPEFVKQKLAEGPARHKDWKVCEHCRVHATEKKLLACARCRPFVTMPVYYCVCHLSDIGIHIDHLLRARNAKRQNGNCIKWSVTL